MVDFEAYATMEPALRELIQFWHYQANHPRDPDSFESFIYLWLGFNGWGIRVTDAETDAAMIKALASERTLNNEFAAWQRTGQNRNIVARFAEFWPIFSVADIRRKGLRDRLYHLNRVERRELLLAANVKRGPKGMYRHVEPDWTMLIEAVYIIRCNLFHGEKGESPEDILIVRSAYEALCWFINDVRLYFWPIR